ncbi:MAG: hypothetical protein HY719_15490 [Planctomycetes bacterium]|nr:hypothetical protein [Planctomycetota bacterium]
MTLCRFVVLVSALLAAGCASRPGVGVVMEFSGLDQNDYGVHDVYHLDVNGVRAADFDEQRPAAGEGGDPADWDHYRFEIGPGLLFEGDNEITLSLDPAAIPDETNVKNLDAHLNFDYFRLTTTDGRALIDAGVEDRSFKELDTQSTTPDHVAVVDLRAGPLPAARFPAHLQGPIYGRGKNGGARGPAHDDYYRAARLLFRLDR